MQKIFNFNDILSNYDVYLATKDEIKNEILSDFSNRKCAAKIIIGEDEVDCTLGFVLVNLLVVKAFVREGFHLTHADLYNHDSVTQDLLENYFNFILNKFRVNNLDYDNIRACISEIINELTDLSGKLNIVKGNSISYRDFTRIMVEDEETAKSLFTPEVKPGPFNEIEAQFNQQGKKIMNYFKEHTESELFPFVMSGTGINAKQLTQCISFIGLKPAMDGSVIPVTVTDNFLNGLQSLESYYINSCGTRKALTTNKVMTRRSGYLTRKLSLSNIDHYHDDSLEDCGTTHFVNFRVDNERKFKQIIGRHYYDLDESGNKISDLKTITENDKELIGKTIGLRSPVTCCGKHVCATCYGRELSRINKDVNTGLVAVLKLTEPLTQKLLSAKHLLSTKTDKVEWGEDFLDIFTINMDSVYFDDTEVNITFAKPRAENFDEDEDAYWIDEFEIQYAGSKKQTTYKAPLKLFINPKLLPVDKMKDGETEVSINSKSLDEDEYIFKYQVHNNELTKSLQQILDLIESSDHLGIDNYHDLVNKFDDLLIENDMDYIMSVHIEMILSVLIRDPSTGKRLDFSKKSLDNYAIYRVTKSVLAAPLAVSLAFERINDQLVDLKTYKKDEVSLMDNLFR